jgi:arginase
VHYGLIGVPSSAAAHWPGQERGPAALREAGFVEALRAGGVRVTDHGDLPVVRWQPDPGRRNPHALQRVIAVLRAAADGVRRVLDGGTTPLVLGGECTLAIPLVTAVTRASGGEPPALVYVDGGVDLRTPADEPSGVLDSMGAAHLLDLPGTDDALASFGDRRPMLPPDHVVYVGHSENPGPDEEALRALPCAQFPADAVRADPAGTASAALAAAAAVADSFVVHFDVDVIGFYELPVADVPQHNLGLTPEQATAVLGTLVAAPGFAGLTICEFNPDHGEPDGSTARALSTALAAALSRAA